MRHYLKQNTTIRKYTGHSLRLLGIIMLFAFPLFFLLEQAQTKLPLAAPAAHASVPSTFSVPEPKEVIVGYTESPNFSEGTSDESKKYGMAYDYLQKVSYYTNWNYKYVYGDWDTLMKKLINGEIDMLAGVSKTPDRNNKMLFPDYPMGNESYYIYAKSSHPLAVSGVYGLAGCTVSVNENSIMKDILTAYNDQNHYRLNIVTYSGNESRYKDFYAEKTDATVDTNNNIIADDKMVPVVQIGQAEYYLAINKNRPDLIEELNSALGKINSIDPNFINKLANTYFFNQVVSTHLQTEEMTWLTEHPVIKIGYIEDYLPLSASDDQGQATGIIKDIIDEMAAKLSINGKAKFVYTPFSSYNEMIDSLKAGKIDAAFPANNDIYEASKADLLISNEVLNIPMYLIYTGDYENLHLKRMSAKKGNSIGDIYIRQHFPDVEIIYYDTIEDMLSAVLRHDVDGCILNQFRKDGYLSHAYFGGLNAISLKDGSNRCFAVNKDHKELLSILNRGITNLPDDYSLNSSYKYTSSMYTLTFKDYLVQHIFAFMLILGIIVALLSGLISYIYVIHRSKKKMHYVATHDALTKLLNRCSYKEYADNFERQKNKVDLIVTVIDINGLKTVNDTLGHEAGDRLILGTANCLKAVLAPYGPIYRMGGDEFLAITDKGLYQWQDLLQELREAFAGWTDPEIKNLAVAIGTADNFNDKKLTLDELQAIADKKMYAEKAAYYKMKGHNRRQTP